MLSTISLVLLVAACVAVGWVCVRFAARLVRGAR
jgi:hypothetical protein